MDHVKDPADASDHRPCPVTLSIESPERYERPQLLVRLIIGAALGAVHQSLFGVIAALYVLLPGVAAIMISQHGGRGLATAHADWMVKILGWLLAFYAYMLFVTDDFPLDSSTRKLRLQLESTGQPTSGDALWRLLSSLPYAIVLLVLGIVSAVISLIIGVCVLFARRAPRALRNFQQTVLGWLARFLACHSSLVEGYPPVETNELDATPSTSGAA
jgi:hypothetical protein